MDLRLDGRETVSVPLAFFYSRIVCQAVKNETRLDLKYPLSFLNHAPLDESHPSQKSIIKNKKNKSPRLSDSGSRTVSLGCTVHSKTYKHQQQQQQLETPKEEAEKAPAHSQVSNFYVYNTSYTPHFPVPYLFPLGVSYFPSFQTPETFLTSLVSMVQPFNAIQWKSS